jgi:uncharacterized protein (TIGR04562 family)
MSEHVASLKSKHKFSLNWDYLGAITNGMSAIDLVSLALRNIDDARQFAREYGFDLDQPATVARILRGHREAVAFILSTFLDPDQHDLMPPQVRMADDPLQLLVYASQRSGQHDALHMWSCAVLKVMHGIFYIDSDLKLRHFHTIREQVFASLDEVIQQDGDAYFLTDGKVCLPLLHYDKKSNKGRNSILLKLLQKAAYLASDIYDHLGVRLTFETRFECLLALDILQRVHLLSVTNIDPQRTRNTLLDLQAAKQVFVKYRALLDRSPSYPAELLLTMDAELRALSTAQTRCDNPHSGSGFSSLQVTLRKMIHLHGEDQDVDFFFEYEIQLMDRESHARTLDGPASHEAYKKRQVEAARLRVLGRELVNLVDASQAGSGIVPGHSGAGDC